MDTVRRPLGVDLDLQLRQLADGDPRLDMYWLCHG